MPAQFEFSPALGKAFHVALLLTGNTFSAERAVSMAIESLDSQDCKAEALLSATVESAIEFFGSSFKQSFSGHPETSPGLPLEMRRVLHMTSPLRHCFVLRVLLGLPHERCARLLHIHEDEVKSRLSAAMQWLAQSVELNQLSLSA